MGGNNNRSRLLLKKKSLKRSPEVEFTGAEEGGGIHFIPITDHTRKYDGVQFGIMDENFKEMPKYIFGGTAKGLKPPKYVFHIGDNGNCLFRVISYILIGSENVHFTLCQSIYVITLKFTIRIYNLSVISEWAKHTLKNLI